MEVLFYRLATAETEFQTITLRNTGDEVLVVDSVSLGGTGFDSFDLDAFSLPFGGLIGPGESVEIYVGFKPLEAGEAGATLNIGSDDPDFPDFAVQLGGFGHLVVPGGGGPPTDPTPPAFAAPPSITPATATTPALFSATITGPAGAVIMLQASTDLGLTDNWAEIGQITLNGTGVGNFTNIADPGSIGTPANFFRLRQD